MALVVGARPRRAAPRGSLDPVATLLCFGLGYCARRAAARLLSAGWRVRGTTRDPAADPGVDPERWPPGVEVLPFTRGRPLPREAWEGVTHVLASVPPDEAGDPVVAMHRDDLAAAGLVWAGYLSSTAVYGDRAGAWVDARIDARIDASAGPSPAPGARGEARLAAERAWQGLLPGVPVHVLRLAGIYGPGRSALDAVRAGRARRIDRPGHVFSRIHVDDVVEALLASIARPTPGAVFDLADELPAPQHEVVAFACELLGAPLPPLEPWEAAAPTLSPALREFYAGCRRVSGARTREALGLTLRHPDYRAGLRSLL